VTCEVLLHTWSRAGWRVRVVAAVLVLAIGLVEDRTDLAILSHIFCCRPAMRNHGVHGRRRSGAATGLEHMRVGL